jgi:antitoxin (DNA-binding transcriptional repressor) of toxin-antitoxin stability system
LGQWIDRVCAGQDVVVTRRGKPVMRLTAVAPLTLTPSADPAVPRLPPPESADGPG